MKTLLRYQRFTDLILLTTIGFLLAYVLFYPCSTATTSCYDLHKFENLTPTLTTVYFYWLDLTMLPILLIVASVIILTLRSKMTKQLIANSYLLLLISITATTTELWNFNALTPYTVLHYHNVNSFLLNSLNKYHPLIFYISALLVLILVSESFFHWKYKRMFQVTNLLNSNLKLRLPILVLSSFSLLLGSWWALQEWTWGGWWNWDPSETFGLGVSLFALYHIHTSLSYWNVKQYNVKTLLLGVWFVGTYFLVQLNFEILSHNFGLDSFLFFNKNTHLIYVSGGLFLFYTKYKTSQLRKLKQTVNGKAFSFYAQCLLTTLVIVVPIFLSYWPIITFLMWKFTTFNGATTLHIPITFFFVLTYMLRESLFKEHLKTQIPAKSISLVTAQPLNIFYLAVVHNGASLVYTLTHGWLLLLIVTNISTLNQDFFSWTGPQKPTHLPENNTFFLNYDAIYCYNPYSFSSYTLWRDVTSTTLFHEATTTLNKTTTVDFYPLATTSNSLYNFHSNLSAKYSPILTTYLHNLPSLAFNTLIGALILVRFLQHPKLSVNNINF